MSNIPSKPSHTKSSLPDSDSPGAPDPTALKSTCPAAKTHTGRCVVASHTTAARHANGTPASDWHLASPSRPLLQPPEPENHASHSHPRPTASAKASAFQTVNYGVARIAEAHRQGTARMHPSHRPQNRKQQDGKLWAHACGSVTSERVRTPHALFRCCDSCQDAQTLPYLRQSHRCIAYFPSIACSGRYRRPCGPIMRFGCRHYTILPQEKFQYTSTF